MRNGANTAKRIVTAMVLLGFILSTRASDMARPWTFWYWMYGAVSKAGIKADLQAMKDVGLGGCYLMPIRGTEDAPATLPPIDKAQQLTPRFWDMVDYAMQQADSLQLQLGIHICDGFALAGGPWITPQESMQKVVWTDTLLTITKKGQHLQLPQPARGHEGYYEDIAAFAVSADESWTSPTLQHPHEGGTIVRNENGVFRSSTPGYILFSYDTAVTVRSIEIVPSGNNIQSQRFLVEASDDGISFRHLRQLVPPRQGWQNTDQNYTYALPETTARYFRLTWTPDGSEPGAEDLDAAKWSPVLKTKEIRLSSVPTIDQYESKNGSVWRIASEGLEVKGAKVYRLPATLAPGRYRILRFGHTATGHTNATAGGAKGLECDKFSASAIEKQMAGWFAQFMQRPHHEVVKYMHIDSWECGSQNWSANFANEFRQRRGYDLLPYLPVMAGVPMDSAEQVLRDIRLTINDLINDVFFVTLRQCANRYGIQLSAESVAPTMVSDGMQHYQHTDLPMGEFWLNSPTHDKPNDMLDAISGAHVYGKTIIQAEGFTEVRGVWDETPASIKTLLDRNFVLGMNRLFFHVFTHNPYTDKRPGMTLDGIGLFFQRNQTWFPEASGLVDYTTRCQTLLQKGRPVVDIAVYTGEEMPRRALTPDRLVPLLPGLFGPERVASERERLANHGSPMVESPVGVRHNANILDLKDWVNPLHGYHYDSMNKDALLTQPFDYKVLVIPEGSRVSPEAQARIDSLRTQGVLIIDRPYTQPHIDGLQPDAILPEGVAFCHRRDGNTDIYFLSNQLDTVQTFTAAFRFGNGSVKVYDPMTSRCTTPIDDIMRQDSLTAVRLTMQPRQSLFVLFNEKDIKAELVSKWHMPLEPDMPRRQMTWKLKGGWQMSFVENGTRLKTDSLFSWADHPDDAVRYFSGHVRYATTLIYKSKNIDSRVILSLGDVRDVAHVWLNGHDLGILWIAPYETDVTDWLRQGKNTLEIEVVNTWHNALRGADRSTPPYEGIWTNAKYRTKGDSLLPAGLLTQPVLRIEN